MLILTRVGVMAPGLVSALGIKLKWFISDIALLGRSTGVSHIVQGEVEGACLGTGVEDLFIIC